MLNLLRDPCWPVERADGHKQTVALIDLVKADAFKGTNPIICLRTPRADLDAAAYALVIAILQTAFMPKDEATWRKYLQDPPTPDQLQTALQGHIEAFELYGDGPCFMQDLELEPSSEKYLAIDSLLLESPGGNTLKHNADIFQKRSQIRRLSPFYTALSLFCLQSQAPSGGVGYRTSLRGGGPLQTLIMPEDPLTPLWQILWVNVLAQNLVLGDLDSKYASFSLKHLYPWFNPTAVSKDGNMIHVDECHPLQKFWAMPRRIRLNPPGDSGTCDVSGVSAKACFNYFTTVNYGNNYDSVNGDHPHTPYARDQAGQRFPVLGKPNMNDYHHWLALTLGVPDPKSDGDQRMPAMVVKQSRIRHRALGDIQFKPHVWIAGFDMDNAKAREWIDFTAPLIVPDGENEASLRRFKRVVKGMIDSARENAKSISNALKAIWVGNPKTRGDLSFAERDFWFDTRPLFFKTLEDVRHEPGNEDLRERWLKDLNRKTMQIFDRYLQQFDFASVDLVKKFQHRQQLHNFTSFTNSKLRSLLDLPKYEKKAKDEVTV